MSEAAIRQWITQATLEKLWDRHHVISFDLKNSKLLFESSNLQDGEYLFDVASLTKVLVVDFIFRHLKKKEGFHLSLNLGKILPNIFMEPSFSYLQNCTVENLLSHRSGLHAWRNFYTKCLDLPNEDYNAILRRVFGQIPWSSKDEGKVIYSDLGYILLSYVLQVISGKNLSVLFEELLSSFFVPERFYSFLPTMEISKHCVDTGYCKVRSQVLKGVVHDENAWALGGISGHAGLFCSAIDIVGFVQKLYSMDYLRDASKSMNLLSWREMSPRTDLSQQAEYKGENLIGHFGFTGTSLWFSPEKAVLSLVLTNRVKMGRLPTERYKLLRNDLIYSLQTL